MKHFATSKFWNYFAKLPLEVQDLANKNFQLLKQNPRHPSLQFKKLGRIWSVRVGLNHHALAAFDNECFYWNWIGTRAEYDKLISA